MSTPQKALLQQKAEGATASEYETLLKRVKELERRYKIGDVDERTGSTSEEQSSFERELNDLEILSRKYEHRFRSEQPAWYYKFLAIQAEAKEYFDTATATYRLDLYVLAQQLYRQLPKRLASDNGEELNHERVNLKNMIRVIVAGLEYLNSIGDFGNALVYAHGLEDFVINKGLATKANPANGTLAVIYNFLGRAYRQRGIDDDYQTAIDYFYRSSESYFEMARHRGNLDVDVIYARTRAMVSLAFGAGFLFYNAQSDLARAKALIAQARLGFLRDNGEICCELHYHYLELLYASIQRAEAGDIASIDSEDPMTGAERSSAEEKLDHALETLERCEKALRSKPKYFIHVLYNQALVYLYQGKYEKARVCIAELLERGAAKPRWIANGLILRSHVERREGEYDAALSDAMAAYTQAGNYLPVRIEALLARGQAQLARRQLVAARADFDKALQLNNGANLKLTAMGSLLLLDVAIAQQKPAEAHTRFTQLQAIMPSISHGFIRNKFRQLERLIVNLQTDFFISANSDELDYKRFDSALQRWLLERVLREDGSLTRAAKRLNVSKKTIYLWVDKYNLKV